MNVLVLVTHGLHCHWLGPYGNEWVSTPAFDALASDAIVFDQNFAEDPSPAGFDRVSHSAFSALRAASVRTCLVVDRKRPAHSLPDSDQLIVTRVHEHPSAGDALIVAVEQALDRLSESDGWLLWVETDRLLPPWEVDPETYQHYASAVGGFAEDDESEPADPDDAIPDPVIGPVLTDDSTVWHRLHNSFAAAVTGFDAELDVLMEVFRERGLDRSATWIVTSDHGWPLGEHGIVGPEGSRLHEELVHLPLIMRLPDRREALRRVPVFTQTADLEPTLLELFGVTPTAGMATTSLLPLATGSTPNPRAVVRSAISRAGHVERAIRTPDWAFLAPVAEAGLPARLHRKPDDVWEMNDLAARHPDECDGLLAMLEEIPTPAEEARASRE
jgi:arylsulfatase A-like enzyme